MSVEPQATARPHDGGRYAPGDVMLGKYRLVEQIAEGGMGTVWIARNLALDAEVALKLIRRELAASDEAAQRLVTEARATAQIDHPSIVKIHDFGETEQGDPFIVMELLKGETLDRLFCNAGRLPAVEIVRILLPIVDALQLAHAKDIVHRDLKPENIIITHNEAGDVVPKLLDFGVAKLRLWTDAAARPPEAGETSRITKVRRAVVRMTRMGVLLGSPAYMAPEQARGDEGIDGRADLWSVSVLLYEAVSGELPFFDEDVEGLLMQILAEEPAPLEVHGVSEPELWSIVERGLQKDRERRWPSAKMLGEALARWLLARGIETDATGRAIRMKWLGHEPSGQPAPPPEPRAEPRAERSRLRWLVAAVVAGGAVAAAAAIFAGSSSRQAAPDHAQEGASSAPEPVSSAPIASVEPLVSSKIAAPQASAQSSAAPPLRRPPIPPRALPRPAPPAEARPAPRAEPSSGGMPMPDISHF